jgi:ABC-type Zn2+ transport system substrate-binding protein/surface adhesin
MKIGKVITVCLAALMLTATTAAAQPYGEAAEESGRRFSEIMKEMGDFVKDVTFEEEDIKSVLKYREELDELGGGGVNEGMAAVEEDSDDMIDFKEVLANADYRSWAKERGLDPDLWMKKFMRVQAMMMQEGLAATASQGSAELQAQLAGLEAQRAQIGEEVYQQMKQAMETGAATMNSLSTAYDDFPEPTASEKALIERYRDQFMDF